MNAVAGVDLDLIRREQYVILGASGSGKSTLLYLLGGLEKADQGHIFLDDQDLTGYTDEELATFRNRQVGFVFQFHFLLPSMNCMDNILLPSKISGKSTKNIKEKVRELANELGVSHCLEKFPFELSGGEQQRINIIRALSLEPELLLCDEPTGNLDSENSQKVVTLLKKLADSYGSTLVIVTHDLSIADQFQNRIVMRDGAVESVELGVKAELSTPRKESVKTVTKTPVSHARRIEEFESHDGEADSYPDFIPESPTMTDEGGGESSVADSWGNPIYESEEGYDAKREYVGLNSEESKSTQDLIDRTQDLISETEDLLDDDD